MSKPQEVLLKALDQIDRTTSSWESEAELDAAIVVYYINGKDGYSALGHVDSGMARWQAAAMLREVARRLDIEGDNDRK
jgi:hypothetical protein